ncbi:hypothetical protein [Microbacterium sp.]|uniref:hypothetical protein n=1 Tax=Microbacterium sp. TaxID=51671 RepID=UPI0039E40671
MPLARDIQNVLPSFRTTRRDLWNGRAVNEYAFEAENAVGLLADMAEDYGAADVIPAVQKAIASTFRVLMRADDSGGAIQLVIRDLLVLHAELCTKAPPAPAVLTKWIQTQQFGELGEYFNIDVADYEEALGEKGLETFERHLEKRRAALTLPFDGRPDLEFEWDDERHARRAVLYNLQRLAVLAEDEEAIVRTHGGDLPKAYLRADAAKALIEAGFLERAASVAKEGMTLDGGSHQQQECGELWVESLGRIDPAGVADAAGEVFRRWPTGGNASAWMDAAGDGVREEAVTLMRKNPRTLVAFLLDADDVTRAWNEALDSLGGAGGGLLPQQWDELVKRYAKVDAVAVLPVMAQLIDDRLVEANTAVYAGAVKRMKELRKAAALAGVPEMADAYLAEWRERFRRRTTLIKRMDAAGV